VGDGRPEDAIRTSVGTLPAEEGLLDVGVNAMANPIAANVRVTNATRTANIGCRENQTRMRVPITAAIANSR
jgi:hypothetical protein